jgi:hypothetical protein
MYFLYKRRELGRGDGSWELGMKHKFWEDKGRGKIV